MERKLGRKDIMISSERRAGSSRIRMRERRGVMVHSTGARKDDLVDSHRTSRILR